MRTPHADFLATKNEETNEPIWLFRINISDTPEVTGEGDLFLAKSDEDVDYFASDGAGGYDAQTYTAFPIEHKGIAEGSDGRISQLQVDVSNITQEIQFFLEDRDGLATRKVTVWQIFRENLSESTAHVEDIFTIDSVVAKEAIVRFTLSSALDIMDVQIPGRMYTRNHCQWLYNGMGCWCESETTGIDYEAPSGFVAEGVILHNPTETSDWEVLVDGAERHSLPASLARVGAAINSVNVPIFDKTNGVIKVEMKCDNPSVLLNTALGGQLELGSYREPNVNEWHIPGDIIHAEGITDEWVEYTFNSSDLVTTGGDLDPSNIIRWQWYHGSNDSSDIVISARNLRIVYDSNLSVAPARFDKVRAPLLTKANGTLEIDLKTSNLNIGTDSSIEISSSGQPDTNEWGLADLSQMATHDDGGKSITASWQTFNIPLSLFGSTGGELDVLNINFMRVYGYSSDALAIDIQWRNAKLTGTFAPDSCNKTLKNCIQHKNQERFGGFPGVPSHRFRGG